MIIKDIDLDSLDRQEYLAFIQVLLSYYYVNFGYELTIVEETTKDVKKD